MHFIRLGPTHRAGLSFRSTLNSNTYFTFSRWVRWMSGPPCPFLAVCLPAIEGVGSTIVPYGKFSAAGEVANFAPIEQE